MKQGASHAHAFERIVRVVADSLMLNFALLVALTLRYVGVVVFERGTRSDPVVFLDFLRGYAIAFLVMTSIALPVFYLSGFYTYGRAYRGRYKILVILQAVSITYLLFGFLSFLSHDISWFPRSALILAWALSGAFMVGSRLWSGLWRAMMAKEYLRGTSFTVSDEPHSILVIGGAGYIGSALVPKLLARGYRVRLLDLCLFGLDPLRQCLDHPRLEVRMADFRHVEEVVAVMRGMDAVVHLGGIVGDPACALDEELTIDVNLVATRMLAEVAKGIGIRRFVFASSCSVYGASNEILDERSALRPVSLYARSKIASERVLVEMGSERFLPTILRFGTIYGVSGRTRFDLVVNLLVAKAVVEGEITVDGGDQWRPFVHVDAAAQSVVDVLGARVACAARETFNVGSDEQNYTILQVAEAIQRLVPRSRIIVRESRGDVRNYRVSFAKIRNVLGFKPRWTLEKGVLQVLEAFRTGSVSDYRDARHHNAQFWIDEGASRLHRGDAKWAENLVSGEGAIGH